VGEVVNNDYLLERIGRTDAEVSAHTARLNTINGQLERGAEAVEKLAIRAGALEVAQAAHAADVSGEFKATRLELRLIALGVALTGVGLKFVPNAAPARTALELVKQLVS
jgi:hypothetical protein